MTEKHKTAVPVDDRTLLQVLTWLQAADIEFMLDQSPHGTYSLDPGEVVAYVANPEAFLAEATDVSIEGYRAWQTARGAIQCHAQTTSGRRCRNLIADEDHYLTPKQWVALQARQLTCWSHGGKALTEKEIAEAEGETIT